MRFCILFILFSLYFIECFDFGHKNISRIKENVVPDPSITKVHIVFMNHLDVGYSDYQAKLVGFSANVINTYFHMHFPNAIKLAQDIRNQGFVEEFKYTTHPWLLYFFLKCPVNLTLANIPIQCPNPTENLNMINAIKRGDILWHDGPMNMNIENMNSFGLNRSLDISGLLNTMFNKVKTGRVLSIRDVPGLSQGAISTLRKNGFIGISSGVNSGSAPPAVPPLALWKSIPEYQGQVDVPEIIYMQDPLGYPNPPGPYPNNPDGMSVKYCHKAPGTTEVLCFFFRNDNLGPPQSIPEVLGGYEILRARYIKAKLVATDFDDFFKLVWTNRHLLPVIDAEMGDTWVQGTASDPKKFARFRAMQREFQFYYESGQPITPEVTDASRFMIKPAEHTYGLPSVGDTINWSNEAFRKVRAGQNFLNEELSWNEQREYLDLVLTILGPNHLLTRRILQAWKELESFENTKVRTNKMKKIDITDPKVVHNFTCNNGSHGINVGFMNGAIVRLDAEDVLISPENAIGELVYQTYNETDTDFWLSYYRTYWNTGYGKPNSTVNAHPESKTWPFVMTGIYRDSSVACGFLIIVKSVNITTNTKYGLPDPLSIRYQIDLEFGEISSQIEWDNKPPTRLMEALFVKFNPKPLKASRWFLSKLGMPISPNTVMLNGSQWQHTTDDSGAFLSKFGYTSALFRTIAWDTGITCPYTQNYGPTAWAAPLSTIKDEIVGVAFNIFNNIWNTNYIYWYPFIGPNNEMDSHFKARFTTQLKLKLYQI